MKMGLLILALACFHSSPISTYEGPKLHVWNVGQGLWATITLSNTCVHFDAGGEKKPYVSVQKLCGGLRQVLFLSHSDWDHVSFVEWIKRADREMCIYKMPIEVLRPRVQRLLSTIAICEKARILELQKLLGLIELTKFDRKTANISSSNDLSRVFLVRGPRRHLLLTGDSTEVAEKIWSPRLNTPIDILLLGHHGSRTSTSNNLLSRIEFNEKSLRPMAIASQRKKKYGHPHPIILKRLQTHSTAAFSTESWGHLHFDL